MLHCCHPHTEAVGCWTSFAALLGYRPEKAANIIKGAEIPEFHPPPVKAKRKSTRNVRLLLPHTVLGATTSTVSENSIPSVPSMILLSAEEHPRLVKLFRLLTRNNPEKDELVEKSRSASFLFALAKAAADVALEDAMESSETEESTENFQDDPEAVVQRLLEAGKRNELLKERHKEHMQRVEILVQDYPDLLEQPLVACWNNLEHSINRDDTTEEAKEASFLSILSMLLGKAGEFATLEFLLTMMDKDDNNHQIYNLMLLCFKLAFSHAFLLEKSPQQLEKFYKDMEVIKTELGSSKRDPALQAMFHSFQEFQKSKARNKNEADKFLHWYSQQIPSLLSPLSLCIREILFPNLNDTREPNTTVWLLPNLDRSIEETFLFSNQSWLFTISCCLPMHHHERVGSKWHRLYATYSEGFNLTTLEHGLTGYRGPTMLLVHAYDEDCKTNRTFGAFASQTWTKQTSPGFYGDGNSFLFQLQPQFKVFRAKESGVSNFQYFYYDKRPMPPTTASKDDSKHGQGLGLGGSSKRPRFFVSASLDTCYLGSGDATFESNNDEPPSNSLWELLALEVWGVGGESALQALAHHRSREECSLRKARQVDKAAFLGDFRSGLIESKMFGHREEMRNRDGGGCLLDCHDEEEDDGRWQIGAPR